MSKGEYTKTNKNIIATNKPRGGDNLHHGNGQKYVDFHMGTIKEPTALQLLISDLTLYQRVW